MKVIIDTNVWISFLIGKRLSALNDILHREEVEIYVSDKLITEIKDVALRPKMREYISIQSLCNLLEMIESTCNHVADFSTEFELLRDDNDLFLVSLIETIPADYLVTGDKDLLVLVQHGKCKIITFNQFYSLLK